jgi:hypothetical protein
VTNPVDDAIAAHNDLPDVLDSQLRNDSSQACKVRQLLGRAEYPVSERRGYLRGVAGNEQTDRLEIIRSLGRPPYFSHLAIRWRTSS